MKKVFQTVKKATIPRSEFDLSHDKKLSMKMGDLIPILVEECVPGDEFKINTESMIRLAPMTAPVMHRMNAYIHYFFVPNRILWSNWEKFITGDWSGTVPAIEVGSAFQNGSIYDYMGLPSGITSDPAGEINALPFRAYKKIWNEYYRDQDVQLEIAFDDDDTHAIMQRCWEKDYFTSCRPWAQKGNPVEFQIESFPSYNEDSVGYSDVLPAIGGLRLDAQVGTTGREIKDTVGNNIEIQNIDASYGSIDMNEFRTAHRIQRWLERNARSGSRYVEHLLTHWGIISDDARLDRPEYIGGGRSPVVISEVLNTFGSEDANAHPQGSMSGHGLNVGNTNQAKKYCKEHGYIIGMMSVIPTSAYYQGLHKKYSRKTVYDFYNVEFARLGEQEVLNKELMATNNQETNEETFGYQARYAEYKYGQSSVHGDFRGNLDFWHMARKFDEQPLLSDPFVRVNNDDDEITRIFNVSDPDVDHLWVQLYHHISAKRPMPYFNDPTI